MVNRSIFFARLAFEPWPSICHVTTHRENKRPGLYLNKNRKSFWLANCIVPCLGW